ncbi:MAG: ECF-type sigma factor [Acidobacteriota bacterium]|nr:ECF-type sigma factor [Acidobacteriota bacterium]
MREPGKDEVDELFGAAYEELRRLAASVRGAGDGQTLNPTALVNEAYVKLVRSLRVRPESVLHFKRIAARAMRQVLVEAARHRKALKRGSGQAMVTFDEQRDGSTTPEEVIALDAALDDLARVNPRQALLVECRFFGGLETREAAALLDVSESTAERDWRAARAWLSLQIRRNG